MTNRLHRSRTDRMVGGVCGGLGKYLGIDPTLVRLFFILLVTAEGAGFLIYLILWIVLPVEGTEAEASIEQNVRAGAEEVAERARSLGKDLRSGLAGANPSAGLLVGAALIMVGALFFLQNLGVRWLEWLRLEALWPLLLVVVGVALLLRGRKEG